MAKVAGLAGPHSRKTTAEARRDSRRLTIDAMFAQQSSHPAPSSSPPSTQPETRLPLTGPRVRKLVHDSSFVAGKRALSPADLEVVTTGTSSQAALAASLSDSPSPSLAPSESAAAPPRSARKTRVSTRKQAESSFVYVSGGSVLEMHRPKQRSLSNPKSSLKRAYQDDGQLTDEPSLHGDSIQTRVSSVPHAQRPSRRSMTSLPKRSLAHEDRILPSPSDSGSSRKRARLATAVEQPSQHQEDQAKSGYGVYIVPSSQSDEQPLTIPKVAQKDPAVVKELVDKWRQASRLCTDIPDESHTGGSDYPDYASTAEPAVPMDVDISVYDPGSPLSSLPTGLQTPQSEPEPDTIPPVPHDMLSPTSCRTAVAAMTTTPAASSSIYAEKDPATRRPKDDLALGPLPSTPVVLDPDTKTAQIIAKMKAKAYAAASCSPHEIPAEMKELGYTESSSDESEDDLMAFIKPNKEKGRACATPPPADTIVCANSPPQHRKSPESKARSSRYSLRRKDANANSAAEVRRFPNALLGNSASVRKQSRKADPLEALLKEKRQAEIRGGGMDALLAAEAAVASTEKAKARLDLLREMDEEDSSDIDPAWADEDAALDVVEKGPRRFKSRSASPLLGFSWDDDDEDESEGELEAAHQKAVEELGEENGQKVGHILTGNRLLREAMSKVKLRDDLLGVSLWDDPTSNADQDMQDDGLPRFPVEQDSPNVHPLLGLFQEAVQSEDISQLNLLLHSSVVGTLEPPHIGALIPWLYALVTDASAHVLSLPAYRSLLYFAGLSTRHTSRPGLSLALIVSTLARLGAKTAVCERLVGTVRPCPRFIVDAAKRENVSYRMVTLVAAFAQGGGIPCADLPGIMCALLLIGMDRRTSSDLKRDIVAAIEKLGQMIPAGPEGLQVEAAVCRRVVQFAKDQIPINQAYLLSLISGACAQTNRIVRNVARALLLRVDETYNALPLLAPIVELLSPAVGSGGIFDIQGNTAKSDYYEDLCCHVEILSKALTDIPGYTALEREALTARPPPSTYGDGSSDMGPAAGSQATHLGRIKTLLDGLHGKIVDTRAAFLDRSRAKAGLQRLSLRVHYQRTASLKPRNLRNYFGQP